jgi:hypothetical protein
MKNVTILSILFLTFFASQAQHQGIKGPIQHTWVFTYLKANESQRDNFKTFIKKNWFAMDSIAVRQGLFKDYQLLENLETANTEWDFIVAVEYYTASTYDDIAQQFEIIRKNHVTVKVNDMTFPQLGKIVKSETLRKSS